MHLSLAGADVVFCIFLFKASKVRIFAERKLQQLLESPKMMADKKSFMIWMNDLTNDIVLSETVTRRVLSDSDLLNSNRPGDRNSNHILDTLDSSSTQLPSSEEKFSPIDSVIANDGISVRAKLGNGLRVPSTSEFENTRVTETDEKKKFEMNTKDAPSEYSTHTKLDRTALNDECRSFEDLTQMTNVNSSSRSSEDQTISIGNLINTMSVTTSNGADLQQMMTGGAAELSAFNDWSSNGTKSSHSTAANTSAAQCDDAAPTPPSSIFFVPSIATKFLTATSAETDVRPTVREKVTAASALQSSEVNFSGSWYPPSIPVTSRSSNLPRHAAGSEVSSSSHGKRDSPFNHVDGNSTSYLPQSRRQLSSASLGPETRNTDPPPPSSSAAPAIVPNRQHFPSSSSAVESVDLSNITFQVITSSSCLTDEQNRTEQTSQ